MNDLTKYPEEARRIIFRAADIKARWMLVNFAEAAYNSGRNDACASLMHAVYYLEDRLAYELFPAPKGKIKIEMEGLA